MTADIPRQQPDTPETQAATRDWLDHWRAGPTRERWTELPPQRGDHAPDLALLDARSGEPTPLSQALARPNVDNPWRLPGEFVVGPDGTLVTSYRLQFCEHWIDPRANLAAIRFAAGELRPAFG